MINEWCVCAVRCSEWNGSGQHVDNASFVLLVRHGAYRHSWWEPPTPAAATQLCTWRVIHDARVRMQISEVTPVLARMGPLHGFCRGGLCITSNGPY